MAGTKKRLLHLFQSNPPVDPGLLVRLFVNRQQQLERALAMLDDELPAQICAVHGDRRVGKSHFVRVLLQKVRSAHLPYEIVEINANTKETPRAVIEEIFFALFARARGLGDESIDGADGELGHRREFADVLARCTVLEPILDGTATTIGWERARTDTEATRASMELVLPPVKVVAGADDARAVSERETSSITAVSDHQIVEVVRELLDLLFAVQRRRTLLLVDDLDLLAAGAEQGPLLATRLVKLLDQFASQPSVLVLATFRELPFSGGNKDFYNFLRLSPLSDADLRHVVDLHVNELHAGEPVFETDALDLILASAQRRVGVLLQRCREIWERGAPPITHAQVIDWARAEVEEQSASSGSLRVWAELRGAVRRGSLEVKLDEDIGATRLPYRILHPVSGQPGVWRVDPIFAVVLREGAV